MKHKKIIIASVVFALVAILVFVFRNKIFKTKSAEMVDNTDYSAPSGTTTQQNENLIINAKSVGDKVTSNADQTITRVSIQNGKFVITGDANARNGLYLGTVKQLTPNGYYIKAASGLKSPYYYVGKSQVK